MNYEKINISGFDCYEPVKKHTTCFREKLIEIKDKISTTGRESQIILCFDEIERIIPNENDNSLDAREKIEEFNSFFGTLRRLNEEKIISFLVADLHPDCNRINYWHILGVSTNPVYKFFKEIFLPPFEKNDTETMISQIGDLMGIQFENCLIS